MNFDVLSSESKYFDANDAREWVSERKGWQYDTFTFSATTVCYRSPFATVVEGWQASGSPEHTSLSLGQLEKAVHTIQYLLSLGQQREW